MTRLQPNLGTPCLLHTPMWCDIPGWEGFYQASSTGEIRSIDRVVHTNNQWGEIVRKHKGQILKAFTRPDGYKSVRLRNSSKSSNQLVHRLVALTFLGAPKPYEEVCHLNGVRCDNRLSNLRWDTRANNHKDKVIHGTSARGSNNPMAKLTEEQILEIRSSKESQHAIAYRFGVCQQLISLIKTRKAWSWL